jgi:concanavalin A-like lectin/glucanase superfamily protein
MLRFAVRSCVSVLHALPRRTSHLLALRGRASLLAALIVLVAPAVAAAGGTADAVTSDQRFRATFGLRHDLAYIREVRARKTRVSRDLGVVLTSREQSLLTARFQESDRLVGAVRRYLGSVGSDSFGGMYIDQANGGAVYVQFTSRVAEHRANLTKLDSSGRIRVVSVANTARQLDALHDRLDRDWRTLFGKGILLYSINTDVRDNEVEVGVKTVDSSTVALLRKRYPGAALRIRQGSPATPESRNDSYPPIKAGLSLWSDLRGIPWCTSGFTAYKRNATSTDYYVLTAGHCDPIGSPFSVGSNPIGAVSQSTWWNGPFSATSDAATIPINRSTRSNQLYLTSDVDIIGVLHVQSPSQEVVGEPVCQSGMVTGVSCGQLESARYSTGSQGGTVITDLRTATYDSTNGDSGAPIYYGQAGLGYTAKGIHHGRLEGCPEPPEPCTRVYSHISNVIVDLGLTGVYVSQGEEVLSDNPRAYYRLGEAQVGKDSTASLHGTYVNVGDGGAGAVSDDKSADFRAGSSSQLEVPHAPALSLGDANGAFSLEAWVNPRAYTTGYGSGVVHKGSSGDGVPEHEVNPGPYRLTIRSTGRVNFAFQHSSSSSHEITTDDNADGKVPLNSWSHIAAVYDGTTMSIYINGVLRKTGSAPNRPLANIKPVWIGARYDGGHRFNGLLDEVALYSKALTQGQVQAHYNARSSGYFLAVALDGPVAYYRLNDAPFLRDETGAAVHGKYLEYDATTLGQIGGVCCDGNTAAKFQGNGRGEVDGTVDAVNRAGDFSVEAWVKPSVLSNARTIVSKGATGTHGGNYWLLTNGDDFHFWYRQNTGGNISNKLLQWPSSKSAVPGVWYHVVGVFDKCDAGQTSCYARLYVNGLLEASASTSGGTPVTNTSPFRIGLAGASSTVNSIGGGTIDDVAVYDYVLSADQVQRHYLSGS